MKCEFYGHLCYHEAFGESDYKCGCIYRYPDSAYHFTQFVELYRFEDKLYEKCLEGEFEFVGNVDDFRLMEE